MDQTNISDLFLYIEETESMIWIAIGKQSVYAVPDHEMNSHQYL